MGLDTEQFVASEASLSHLLCPICHAVFEDPVYSCGQPCECTFCRKCITDALRHRSACPMDRKPLTLAGLVPHRFAQGMIDQLEVVCPNRSEGCFWTGRFDARGGHRSACLAVKTSVLQKEIHEVKSTTIPEMQECIDILKLTVHTQNQSMTQLQTMVQSQQECMDALKSDAQRTNSIVTQLQTTVQSQKECMDALKSHAQRTNFITTRLQAHLDESVIDRQRYSYTAASSSSHSWSKEDTRQVWSVYLQQEINAFVIAGSHPLACFPLSPPSLSHSMCDEVIAKNELRESHSQCELSFDRVWEALHRGMRSKKVEMSKWPVFIYTSTGCNGRDSSGFEPVCLIHDSTSRDINRVLRKGNFQKLNSYLVLLQHCLREHSSSQFPFTTAWRGMSLIRSMSVTDLYKTFPLRHEIAFPSLTSTSIDKIIAYSYAIPRYAFGPDKKWLDEVCMLNMCDSHDVRINWLIFKIELQSKILDIYWVGDLTFFPEEKEVLIMPFVPLMVSDITLLSAHGSRGAEICLKVVGPSPLFACCRQVKTR